MRTWQVYLTSGTCLFLVFIFFSYLVDVNLFKQVDFDTTVRLQDNIERKFDTIFSWFSLFGMFEVTTIALIGTLIVGRKTIAGLITLFIFGAFHIIEILGKAVVENVPPPEFLLRTKRFIEFPQFHIRSEYSYPSGHSGRTIFLSVILILLLWHQRKISRFLTMALTVVIVVFDFIMLLSRVYLGEHWVSDVIGGTILGSSLGLIAGSVYIQTTQNARNNQKSKKAPA